MEIQQLRHFLAAVRCGNLSKAADEEFITQSGLSRSIKSLENMLGVELLKRSSKGITTTAFGQALIPHAELVLNNARKAAEAIANIAQMQTGSVTIGVTLNYGYYLIPEVLCELLERYPALSVEVHSNAYQVVMDMLTRAEVDLVFGLIDATYTRPDIQVKELFVTRSIVVAPPDHPLAGRPGVTATDLAGHQWVMLNAPGFQKAFAEHFSRAKVPVPVQVVKTNSMALVRAIMYRANRLTILPKEIVEHDIADGRLAQIDTATPADFAKAGIALNTNANITPAMEAIIQIIEARSAAHYDPETASSSQPGTAN